MTTKYYILLSSLLLLIGKNIATAKQVRVDFYGHPVVFSIQGEWHTQSTVCQQKEQLESQLNAWLASNQIDSISNQLTYWSNVYDLDDLGYLLLLNKLTDQLLRYNADNCKTLFKYAVLNQKGLDVFLGYTQNRITLYGRTNIMIDNCLYIERGSKKYFDLSFNQQKEPEAEALFVMHHSRNVLPLVVNTITPPKLNALVTKRTIPYEFDGMVYFLPVSVNQSLVAYYHDLPTINIGTMYLNYGLSLNAQQTLVSEIKKATQPYQTTAALSFILGFVQQSFEYKKDEEIYGQEKFSFPEETLVNRYADCEDKAILFAVLVQQVLGLKTVALYYKDAEHINVAVETWKQKQEGQFIFNNHKYIVCEPSAKGFALGDNGQNVSVAQLIDW